MSHAIIAVMAGLFCALAGARFAASLKSEAHRLKRWVQVLQHLHLLFQEGTMSIPEALCTAADGTLPPDRLLRELALCLQRSPLNTLCDAFSPHKDALPEGHVLLRMFSRLGNGSKESRCLAIQQTVDELQLMADNAAAKAEKDARLWQTLGLVGGACLTIMLL